MSVLMNSNERAVVQHISLAIRYDFRDLSSIRELRIMRKKWVLHKLSSCVRDVIPTAAQRLRLAVTVACPCSSILETSCVR